MIGTGSTTRGRFFGLPPPSVAVGFGNMCALRLHDSCASVWLRRLRTGSRLVCMLHDN